MRRDSPAGNTQWVISPSRIPLCSRLDLNQQPLGVVRYAPIAPRKHLQYPLVDSNYFLLDVSQTHYLCAKGTYQSINKVTMGSALPPTTLLGLRYGTPRDSNPPVKASCFLTHPRHCYNFVQ